MTETLLTLRDVEERLAGFETRYHLSSDEFEQNPEVRKNVSDEDEFEWEACIHHREAIQEESRECELQRDYIYRVTIQNDYAPMTRRCQAMLAA